MVFEDVVERMINENNNPLILDAWVDNDVEAFRCVKEMFKQGDTMLEFIKSWNFKFKCDYKPVVVSEWVNTIQKLDYIV